MTPVSDPAAAANDGFRCLVHHGRDAATLRLAGELDMSNAAEVERPLRDLTSLGFRTVVVDLRELTFLDSTGIALLVRWQRRGHDEGFALQVVMGGEAVRRPLELTGVLATLDVVPPPADA